VHHQHVNNQQDINNFLFYCIEGQVVATGQMPNTLLGGLKIRKKEHDML
jgi:hypothetical protein